MEDIAKWTENYGFQPTDFGGAETYPLDNYVTHYVEKEERKPDIPSGAEDFIVHRQVFFDENSDSQEFLSNNGIKTHYHGGYYFVVVLEDVSNEHIAALRCKYPHNTVVKYVDINR